MNFISSEYIFVNFSRKTGCLRARNRQYRALNSSPCLFVCCCKVVDHFAEARVHIFVIANVTSDACHTILDQITPCQKHLAGRVELSRLCLLLCGRTQRQRRPWRRDWNLAETVFGRGNGSADSGGLFLRYRRHLDHYHSRITTFC